MNKKLKRNLLLGILLVILCFSLTGCGIPQFSNVSQVETTFDNTTITVSSSTDTNFKLYIELESHNSKSFFETGKLAITNTASQSYDLKNLVGNYISNDAKIVSIKVKSVLITDWAITILILVIVAFLIGYFVKWFRTLINK